jgi:hypothetical protein
MSAPAGVASLPMYPFAAWRDATDTLWEAVRGAEPHLPPLAPWGLDAHGLWHDPAMVVSQACGWPLVTELAGRVRVVGTFRYAPPTGRATTTALWSSPATGRSRARSQTCSMVRAPR